MTALFDVLKIVLPAIITGMFTFLITKYSYEKNRPLDKLEITYNRVYYPLYKYISKNDTEDINSIISKSQYYLKKYDKYVDRSTRMSFDFLCRCTTNTKKKAAYQNFKNNVFDKNAYLRRRLGYLEPSFLQIYTYLSKPEKSTFRISMELLFVYFSLIFSSVQEELIRTAAIYVSCITFLIIVFEIVCKGIVFLYYKIRK